MTDQATTEADDAVEEPTDSVTAAPSDEIQADPTDEEVDAVGDPEVVEAAAAAEAIPEPTVVGHSVIQDNVSEPGMQHTHSLVDGNLVASSHQTVPDPVIADPVEDDAEEDGEEDEGSF